jgi:hypothetical protein
MLGCRNRRETSPEAVSFGEKERLNLTYFVNDSPSIDRKA